MSWREINLKSHVGSAVTALGRAHWCATRVAVMACAGIVLIGGVARLSAQENPLREGDAGYLQQLLPSLQKIQAESSSSPEPAAAQDLRFNTTSSTAQSNGGEQYGTRSDAGLWRPESAPRNPDAPGSSNAFEQTEVRLPDSRSSLPWPESGGIANQPRSAAVTNSNPKATSGSGKNGSARDASARPEGIGKLAAFQGVESLKLNSTAVKIGLNTLLVLAASVGLIVVVRRGMPRQVQTAKTPAGRLKIEQTLSLGGKAELKVVRCGLHQVLVAIDNGGIKSVVALEPSLEPERENLTPTAESQPPAPLKEPVNIEQFVKMIRDMEGDLMSTRTGR